MTKIEADGPRHRSSWSPSGLKPRVEKSQPWQSIPPFNATPLSKGVGGSRSTAKQRFWTVRPLIKHVFRVSRLQSKVGTKYFLGLWTFMRKMLGKLPEICWPIILWGLKQSPAKFQQNFLQRFPCTKSKNDRRASTRAYLKGWTSTPLT